MMKRFVKRNAAGKITGSFAAPQPGRAMEELAIDDADLTKFERPSVSTAGVIANTEIATNPALRGLVRALAKRLGVTPAELIAEIRAEA